MSVRTKILGRLRQRKRLVIGALLPLLSAVWLSAAGSLCFGMTGDGDLAAAHDHGSEHTAHDHSAPARDHETPRHGHVCPHCPSGMTGSSAPESHITCAALDDLTDSGSASKPQSTAHADLALTPVFTLPAVTQRAGPSRRVATAFATDHPLVPLNLLHCVFLI